MLHICDLDPSTPFGSISEAAGTNDDPPVSSAITLPRRPPPRSQARLDTLSHTLTRIHTHTPLQHLPCVIFLFPQTLKLWRVPVWLTHSSTEVLPATRAEGSNQQQSDFLETHAGWGECVRSRLWRNGSHETEIKKQTNMEMGLKEIHSQMLLFVLLVFSNRAREK